MPVASCQLPVRLGIGIVLAVSIAAMAVTDEPATRPVTTAPTMALKVLVGQLGDADPEVRDRARGELMGLDREKLEDLRLAAAANRPLTPGQALLLREIVTHIHMTGENYKSTGNAGFLGVTSSTSNVGVDLNAPPPRPEGSPPDIDRDKTAGIVVSSRVPGFCGYRALEDGDVILRLRVDQQVIEMRNYADLQMVIKQLHPGDVVGMDILRRGRLLKPSIKLDRRPEWADFNVDVSEGVRPAELRAEDYWDRNFAPLVDDRTS